MVYLTAYFSQGDDDAVETEQEFNVNSAGFYKLKTITEFATSRPEGRQDYQLIYVAEGAAHFIVDGQDTILPAGTAFIYRPFAPQNYVYYLNENPNIYWLHFSGKDMEGYLDSLGFGGKDYVYVSYHRQYSELFERIIRELQFKKTHFRELASALARELFLVMSRSRAAIKAGVYNDKQIEKVVEKMYKHFSEPHGVEAYAKELNISRGWFLRRFKKQTAMSPQRFLMEIRMQKAKELLISSDHNITEVARTVGYEDPLYFSRIFKKETGMSPREFKEKV